MVFLPNEICYNLRYARLIVRLISNMPIPRILNNFIFTLRNQNSVFEDHGGISLYSGVPGPECGHQVESSSYFDRSIKI